MKRILIVDDSLTARMMIRRSLEFVGFSNAQFFEAGNGREAIEMLLKQMVDLILTDMNMPEMDGKSFVRLLKCSPKFNVIPVIIISSIATPEEESYLRSRGVAAVIRKPISPMMLRETLASLKFSS